jgi:hypothetical protein
MLKKMQKELLNNLKLILFLFNIDRRKKTFFSYEGTVASIYNPEEIFPRDVFFPLAGTILSAIKDRFEQLKFHSDMWNFLYNIENLPKREDLLKHCMILQENLKVEESSDINCLELCGE